jgi:hypothetical protein
VIKVHVTNVGLQNFGIRTLSYVRGVGTIARSVPMETGVATLVIQGTMR